MASSGTDHIPEHDAVEGSEATIEIKIRTLDSQTYTLRVDKQMPVPVLKEQIASVTGVLSEQQRLICNGCLLKDDKLLSAYLVEDGHTVHLVVRQPIPPSSEGLSNHSGNKNDFVQGSVSDTSVESSAPCSSTTSRTTNIASTMSVSPSAILTDSGPSTSAQATSAENRSLEGMIFSLSQLINSSESEMSSDPSLSLVLQAAHAVFADKFSHELKFKELETQLNILSKENSELKSSLKASKHNRNELKDLKAECANLVSQLDSSKETIESLVQRNVSLAQEVESLRSAAIIQEKRIKLLEIGNSKSTPEKPSVHP